MAPRVRPSTVWGQNCCCRQWKQKSMSISRYENGGRPRAPSVRLAALRPLLVGQLVGGAEQVELPALHPVHVHVAGLDVAVGLEGDVLRDALVRAEVVHVVAELGSGGVPR